MTRDAGPTVGRLAAAALVAVVLIVLGDGWAWTAAALLVAAGIALLGPFLAVLAAVAAAIVLAGWLVLLLLAGTLGAASILIAVAVLAALAAAPLLALGSTGPRTVFAGLLAVWLVVAVSGLPRDPRPADGALIDLEVRDGRTALWMTAGPERCATVTVESLDGFLGLGTRRVLSESICAETRAGRELLLRELSTAGDSSPLAVVGLTTPRIEGIRLVRGLGDPVEIDSILPDEDSPHGLLGDLVTGSRDFEAVEAIDGDGRTIVRRALPGRATTGLPAPDGEDEDDSAEEGGDAGDADG